MAFALVFPGQGSQSVGMMAAYGESAVIRDTFAEASDALGGGSVGDGLRRPCRASGAHRQYPAADADRRCRRLARPAGGGWAEAGHVVAGHSLGEYSALVAAGAMAFLRMRCRWCASRAGDAGSRARGRRRHGGGDGPGARRWARGLRRKRSGQVVEAANLNAPGQIVIAGAKAAVERASEIAKAKGAKRAVLLPVSAPFHCALMRPAAERLAERLAGVSIVKPEIDVINNVDVAVYDDPEKIRDALVRQAYSPVRWIELVQAIAARGMSHVIECGPGKVLAGMTKRIAKDVEGGSAASTPPVSNKPLRQ